MKAFITSGTYDYLETIRKKNENENIIIMQNDEDLALLYHETINGTIFKEPRKYEIIDSAGSFENAGYVVMNHIPVTDEGRPLFEHRFKNRPKLLEKQPGFAAIRVLRPLSLNTYIVLTAWETGEAFSEWQKSSDFEKSHINPEVANPQAKIFSGNSYVKKFTIPKEE